MKRIAMAAIGLSLLSGCATSPTSIQATYVSPSAYSGMSCDQLREEASRVSSQAAAAVGEQNNKVARDAVAMTTALVLFWPAAFFVRGDQGNAGVVANLKGHMAAIEEVNRMKNCGIEFAAS